MLVRSVIYGWGFDFMRPFQMRHLPRKEAAGHRCSAALTLSLEAYIWKQLLMI